MGWINNKHVSLDYISEHYEVIIPDTSALRQYLMGVGQNHIEDLDFFYSLRDKMESGTICIIPQPIIKELEKLGPKGSSRERARARLLKTYKKTQRRHSSQFNQEEMNFKEIENEYWQFGVSRADVSTLVYAKESIGMFGSTAIISNDIKGIARMWNHHKRDSGVPSEMLGFFPRIGRNLFEEFT